MTTPRFSRSPKPATVGAAPVIDLMPAGEVDRRARVALMERWGWATVAALAATALVSGGAFYLQLAAEQRLAAETSTTQSLLGDLEELSAVSSAIASRAELETFGSQSMASDIDWDRFLSDVDATIPSGMTLAGFDLFPGGVPQGDDPAVETGLTGQITYATKGPVDFAPTIRALRDTEGVILADGRELQTIDADGFLVYNYIASFTIDQSIYTGAYDYAKEGEE
jgi:hypothetical protein